MKYVMLGCAAIIGILIYFSSRTPEGAIGRLTPDSGCRIDAYGSGVYYFGCSSEFGKALADFARTRQIISITTDVRLQNTAGYWVVTSK